MNYLDYREKLGIGFDDKGKFQFFLTLMMNFMTVYDSTYPPLFSAEEYFEFCVRTGREFSQNPNGGEYFGSIVSLLRNSTTLESFLSYYIFFLISYNDEKGKDIKKDHWIDLLKTSLTASRIPFEIIDDNGSMFLFPQGAKELDNALVSTPLEWLKNYPETRKIYSHALRQYANGDNKRDIADNFRKALEEFFREFLSNKKDLAKNKSEICKYLKSKGADNNITNMLEPLLAYYKQLNDDQVKHKDTLDAKFLEFLMYQTGLFIRMIITVGKEEQHDNDI